MNNYINDVKENLMVTYSPSEIVLDYGVGPLLYDTNGNEYLDFAAGIAVCGLGYSNDEWKSAIKGQIDKLVHTSNLYYNTNLGKAAKVLKNLTQMERVFFTNSGTESIEGALKMAREYFYKQGKEKFEFIAMENSFHGRSTGALAVTGTEKFRKPFEPLMPKVSFATFNDIESVKALITEKTCAIILEAIQGEGGVSTATPEFMEGIRKLCDEHDILMICDEVQCGMGRSGKYFAWQNYTVAPDIMTMAKGIGNGIPVGAFAANKKVSDNSFSVGDHGATYGGNPLAAMAVIATAEQFEKLDIISNVNKVGAYLKTKLEDLMAKTDKILSIRGMGLIQGIEFAPEIDPDELSKKALSKGLIIISAKGNVIRLVPPLIITEKHVDQMIGTLESCLNILPRL